MGMKRVILASGAVLALAGCGGGASPAAAPAPATSSWSAQQATVQGCRALARWENTYSGSDTAANSPQVQQIIAAASGTKFASDVTTWVDDLQNADVTDAQADAEQVDADCAADGVPSVIGGS